MRSRLLVCAYTLIMLAAAPRLPAQDAPARPAQYRITDLGPLPGGDFSQATFISNNGLISGISTDANATQHAVTWSQGSIFPLGNLLGGPNSGAFGVNEAGLISGQAEVSQADPNHENFCAYFTGLQCRAFAWHGGVIKQLPTLGGNNGTVGPPNRRGQIPGVAETNAIDPSCPTQAAANGTGPQVLQFEPVVWDANAVTVHQLPLPAGDTVGMALWLNNQGQAVGSTGTCANTLVPPFAIGEHAVLWDKNGTVHDLGNLGGSANPKVLGAGNVAFGINDQGQVTGVSVLPDGVNYHAFLWTSGTGMLDIGTLPGDNISAGLGINDLGDIAGASISGSDPLTGIPKAVVWHNGAITDLNTVVPADTSLILLTAFIINDAGQVVGFGLDLNTFEVHGFLATPLAPDAAPAARGPVKLLILRSGANEQLQHRRIF